MVEIQESACNGAKIMDSGEAVYRLLFKRKYLLVVAVIVGIAAFFVAAHRSSPSFRAEARIMLGPELNSSQEAQTVVNRARAIATSNQILGQAVKTAHVERTVEQIKGNVDLTSVGDSGIAQLSVQDADPAVAAVLCRSLADATANFVNATNSASLKATLASIDSELQQAMTQYAQVQPQALTGSASSTAELAAITDNMNALAAARGQLLAKQAQSVPASVVDEPAPLGVKQSSDRGLLAGLCVIGALLFWLLAAAVMESIRPTWTDAGSLARRFGAPTLGRISADVSPDDPATIAAIDRLVLSAQRLGTDVVVLGADDALPDQFARRLESLLKARKERLLAMSRKSSQDFREYQPPRPAPPPVHGSSTADGRVLTEPRLGELASSAIPGPHTVLTLESSSLAPADGAGVVLVGARHQRRSAVCQVEQLLSCSEWPVIGAIEVARS